MFDSKNTKKTGLFEVFTPKQIEGVECPPQIFYCRTPLRQAIMGQSFKQQKVVVFLQH